MLSPKSVTKKPSFAQLVDDAVVDDVLPVVGFEAVGCLRIRLLLDDGVHGVAKNVRHALKRLRLGVEAVGAVDVFLRRVGIVLAIGLNREGLVVVELLDGFGV